MVAYGDIFCAFSKAKVKYVVVGGMAVNLLGSMRATFDLDILVEMSDSNLRKIVSILKKMGYCVKQPVDPMGIADKATREDWIKNKHMKAFNFYNEKAWKEVDIIIDSPVSYEQAKRSVKRIKIPGASLPVISRRLLIKMKSKAARDLDKQDIKSLRKIATWKGGR
jgi:predicted nucleotidyltransferase